MANASRSSVAASQPTWRPREATVAPPRHASRTSRQERLAPSHDSSDALVLMTAADATTGRATPSRPRGPGGSYDPPSRPRRGVCLRGAISSGPAVLTGHHAAGESPLAGVPVELDDDLRRRPWHESGRARSPLGVAGHGLHPEDDLERHVSVAMEDPEAISTAASIPAGSRRVVAVSWWSAGERVATRSPTTGW